MNAERLGIQYFIWDQMEWQASSPSGQKFTSYHGASKHYDHLHVELTLAAANRVNFLPVDVYAPDASCREVSGQCLGPNLCPSPSSYVSGKCPSFTGTIMCCVPNVPTQKQQCDAQCAKVGPACTGAMQSVVGKSTCVCSCPTAKPQMCGSSTTGKYPCVGGVCYSPADGKDMCKTSTLKTAVPKTCVPC